MDAQKAIIIEKLKALKLSHLEVNDCWYSCPKASNYCGKTDDLPFEERECECGADAHNQSIDELILLIQAL